MSGSPDVSTPEIFKRTPLRRNTGAYMSVGGETVTNDVRLVRVQRDMQDVTTEGFRTLGIVSTFIAGVEAQCLSLIAAAQGDSTTGLLEAAHALLLTGLLLSSFGAAVSLLSARWFDLLRPDEAELLEARWEDARRQSRKDTRVPDNEKASATPTPEPTENGQDTHKEHIRWRDFVLAKAVQYTLLMVFLGFYAFIIGMVLYAWATRPNITAIITTVITLIGTLFMVSLHLDFHTKGTLQVMHFNRLRI